METVNFKYAYPYTGYGKEGRFQYQWSESRIRLNGSYTYPLIFNTPVPKVNFIKIYIEIDNTGSGTVYNRSWNLKVYRQNYGWYDVKTFTLPEGGRITLECEIKDLDIAQIAAVPSSNPGTSRTWDMWYDITDLTLTEAVELSDLSKGHFFYGVFNNNYGLDKKLSEVIVNIDGALKNASKIMVNVDGELKEVQSALSCHIKTENDKLNLFKFQPHKSGKYRITQRNIEGNHEIRTYKSDFTPMNESYFYNQSFDLSANEIYYISVIQCLGSKMGESYLQIYKED